MDASIVQRSAIPVELDDRPVPKRIGLVTLSTDHTFEHDFQRVCPLDKVGLYSNRVLFENPTNPTTLRQMLPRIQDAAGLILGGFELDAVCYGCTAATVVIGDDPITEAVQGAKPGVPVITPSGSSALDLKAVGAKRISILTPYNIETSTPFTDYFSSRGFEVVRLECLGLDDDGDISRVSRATIFDAAKAAMTPDSDAIFLSCTALRAVECIDELEQELGKPAVGSNQASIWLSLRRAGIDDAIPGFGKLLTHGVPA